MADWNAYRQGVADTAGPRAPRGPQRGERPYRDEGGGQSGRRAERCRPAFPWGASRRGGSGERKPRTQAERIRALEEEVTAREKALNDANERIAQLEKTLKDMQKLVELKSPGMAAAQQQAQQAVKPKPEPKPEAKPRSKPEPAPAEAGASRSRSRSPRSPKRGSPSCKAGPPRAKPEPEGSEARARDAKLLMRRLKPRLRRPNQRP